MAENGDIPGGVDLPLAFEYYLIAAAHGSSLAYFRLAKLYHPYYHSKLISFSYREGLVEKKNPELEYFYTKQAAELGKGSLKRLT